MDLVIVILVVVGSVILHELAHGLVAFWLGDDTAKDAGRQLRQIEVRQQACDHPILWGVEETNYLKFFLFQVI